MQYFFSQNPQKLPLFQAVKLVVPLKKHNNKIAVECIQDIEPNHENSNWRRKKVENSYLFDMWRKRAIVKLTIACSPQVKDIIFPNKFSDTCTFTVCFETGKKQHMWNQLFSRLKLDVQCTIFTRRVGTNCLLMCQDILRWVKPYWNKWKSTLCNKNWQRAWHYTSILAMLLYFIASQCR